METRVGARTDAMSQSDPLIGRVLDGRWKVEEQIGRGGMGHVYRGRQLSVDRVVAIKVIRPKHIASSNYTARFIREGRLTTAVNHPNLVTVYDFGETEDGVLYLAMEYLSGVTLSDWLATHPSLEERLDVAGEILDGLGAAHDKDIVHRDLKPGNIMLVDDPSVLLKVLDFGLAKSLSVDRSVTGAGVFIGTLHYASPEQCRADTIDCRADLYGFGCVFYLMLAGRLPFTGVNRETVRQAHLRGTVPPLDNLPIDGVTDALKAVVYRLLEKSPDDRFQTAAEAKEALLTATADTLDAIPQREESVDEGQTEEIKGDALIELRAAIEAMNAMATNETTSAKRSGEDPPELGSTYPSPDDPSTPANETVDVEADTELVADAVVRAMREALSHDAGATDDSDALDRTQMLEAPRITSPIPVDEDDDPTSAEAKPVAAPALPKAVAKIPKADGVASRRDPQRAVATERVDIGVESVDSEAVTLVRLSDTLPQVKPSRTPLSRASIWWSIAIVTVLAIAAGWILGRSKTRAKHAPAAKAVVTLSNESPTPTMSPRQPVPPSSVIIEPEPIDPIAPKVERRRKKARPQEAARRPRSDFDRGTTAFESRDCGRAVEHFSTFLASASRDDARRAQVQARIKFCQREVEKLDALYEAGTKAYELRDCRRALSNYTEFMKRAYHGDARFSMVQTRVDFCHRKLRP